MHAGKEGNCVFANFGSLLSKCKYVHSYVVHLLNRVGLILYLQLWSLVIFNLQLRISSVSIVLILTDSFDAGVLFFYIFESPLPSN